MKALEPLGFGQNVMPKMPNAVRVSKTLRCQICRRQSRLCQSAARCRACQVCRTASARDGDFSTAKSISRRSRMIQNDYAHVFPQP